MDRKNLEFISGCLLGGAIGDALGAPVEFLSLSQILQQFGAAGITDFIELNSNGLAEFTDDTQMTLFTAEGLLIAWERGKERGIWNPADTIQMAYMRWLKTQRSSRKAANHWDDAADGWLLKNNGMWKVKAPGNTCLSALASGKTGTPDEPINHSKGCGGVMRAAPLGFLFSEKNAFDQGVKAAAITHGHPSGYLSAGCLSQIIADILRIPQDHQPPRQILLDAIDRCIVSLKEWPNHEETLHSIQAALALADNSHHTVSSLAVESLGGGWVGEEALAISLYCALAYPENFRAAVLLSVNHSGDSDSTGSICGNILGALLGQSAIPGEWLNRIEMKAEIVRMAQMFIA